MLIPIVWKNHLGIVLLGNFCSMYHMALRLCCSVSHELVLDVIVVAVGTWSRILIVLLLPTTCRLCELLSHDISSWVRDHRCCQRSYCKDYFWISFSSTRWELLRVAITAVCFEGNFEHFLVATMIYNFCSLSYGIAGSSSLNPLIIPMESFENRETVYKSQLALSLISVCASKTSQIMWYTCSGLFAGEWWWPIGLDIPGFSFATI